MWFRDRTRDAGFDGLHLQAILRKQLSADVTGIPGEGEHVQREVVDQLGFDSLTHYQWVHLARPDGEYLSWGEEAIQEWARVDDQYNVPYFPHVSIGWDNNPRFRDYREDLINDADPDTFRRFLGKARTFVDEHPGQPPLVTINSWNEWAESSYLEPNQTHGYAYLEAVEEAFE